MTESESASSKRTLALSPGDRLGRYEIVAVLGAGGMGEVYRAHDPPLQRDVALKILRRPSADAEHVARFSREARAAGGLNHPNIVAVYDVGTEAGVPYVVSELLEGETLRARLDRGPVPFRKAVDYGIQIAQALDAAHAKGIWHRDVKPANAFVTTDGRVKLLDFGIAKLSERKPGSDDPTEEISRAHEVLGTAGYMSPEQVLGQPVDHRADIFALGALLYEMFTGARAFKRSSTVDTMAAVLHDDPVDPLTLRPGLPPGAVAVVRRCLEKNREERFQSARDLAFDLQQLRDATVTTRPFRLPLWSLRRKVGPLIVGASLLLGGVALGWWLTRPAVSAGPAAPPTFQPLTVGRARFGNARFAADGRTVVYSEARRENTLRLWRVDPADSAALPLDYPPDTDILAARTGELALSVNRRFILGDRFVGTLALAPMGGAASPREENIEDADWDPAGAQLAVVRSTGEISGQSWLEYPLRTKVYATAGSIRFPRVSRDGRRIAFVEDPGGRAASGFVKVLDLYDRRVTTLTDEQKSVRGLAWSADGSEIWFTAGDLRSHRVLRAVDLAGRQQVLMDAPGSLTLWDIRADGRVLLTRDEERRAMVGRPPGETAERDFSWLDDTGVAALSDDGRQVLFADGFGIFLQPTEKGSRPTRLRLADGFADDLSPDGKWVLATRTNQGELVRVPTGAGESYPLPAHGIISYRGAQWFPGGQRILFNGQEKGGALRSYVQEIRGGPPKPITPENVRSVAISPDGNWVAAVGTGQGISLWPVAGGPPRPVRGSQEGDRPVAFSSDGREIWASRRNEVSFEVFRLDIDSGRREHFKTLIPPDVAGLHSISAFYITPGGDAYFYSYRTVLSELYLVQGLK